MSDSADHLARTRLAILEHLQRKKDGPRAVERNTERNPGRNDRPESAATGGAAPPAAGADAQPRAAAGTGPRSRGGRFSQFAGASREYWEHHPARLVVEVAKPMLSAYATRHPMRYLGLAAAGGALLVLARPWKLLSLSGLVVAVLRSPGLTRLVTSAFSAASYPAEGEPPV